MKRPETKYVAVGDANVAYQVLGDSRPELLFGWVVEGTWDIGGKDRPN